MVSFQEKLCIIFLLSVLFSGGLGCSFLGFFFWIIRLIFTALQGTSGWPRQKKDLSSSHLCSATCSLSSQGTQITEPRETKHSWCPGVRQPKSSSPTLRAHPGKQNSWDSKFNVLSIPRSCTHHMQWDNKSSSPSSVLVPLKFTWQTRDVISRMMSLHGAGRVLLVYLSFLLKK